MKNKKKSDIDILYPSLMDDRHFHFEKNFLKKFKNYKVLVIVNRKSNQILFENENYEVIKLPEYFEVKKKSLEKEISEINKIKRKYKIQSSLLKIIETSFLQSKRIYQTRSFAVNFFIETIKSLEKIFENYNIKNVFQLDSMDIERVCLSYVSQKYAKNYFGYSEIPIPGNEFILVDNKDFQVVNLKNTINNIKSINYDIINKIKAKIEEEKKNGLFLKSKKKFHIINFVVKIFYKLKDKLFYGSIKILIFQLIKNYFLRLINVLLIKFVEDDVDYSKKYVFFPMHADLESTTIYYGFPHRNQFDLIESIALSLPEDMYLYVKEHPGHQGSFGFQNFWKMKSIGNIKIIPSNENSLNLIKKSKICAVINSSVWFEALLYEKPLITFGKGIYSGFEISYEVTDIFKLDEVIELALNSEIPKIERIRFLNAVYKLSFPHRYYYYLWDHKQGEENYYQIIKSLIENKKNVTGL